MFIHLNFHKYTICYFFNAVISFFYCTDVYCNFFVMVPFYIQPHHSLWIRELLGLHAQSDCVLSALFAHPPLWHSCSLSFFCCLQTLLSLKQTGVQQNTPAILSAPSSLFVSHLHAWCPLHLPMPLQMSAFTSSAIKGSAVAAGSTQTWLLFLIYTSSHKKGDGSMTRNICFPWNPEWFDLTNRYKNMCSGLVLCNSLLSNGWYDALKNKTGLDF